MSSVIGSFDYVPIILENRLLGAVCRRFINCLRLALAERKACGFSFRFGSLPELCFQFGVFMTLLSMSVVEIKNKFDQWTFREIHKLIVIFI